MIEIIGNILVKGIKRLHFSWFWNGRIGPRHIMVLKYIRPNRRFWTKKLSIISAFELNSYNFRSSTLEIYYHYI